MKVIQYSLLFLLICISFACEQDDPVIPNEEELISTLTYTLTPMDGGADITLSFVDLDGDGGNAPTLTAPPLQENTTYTGSLTLLDETVSPSENISNEVIAEADEHQFFLTTTAIDGVIINYTDMDQGGNPLGQMTSLSTSSSGTGTLTIILRHKPDKNASGVSQGMIENAGGETDIEVTFPLVIQ